MAQGLHAQIPLTDPNSPMVDTDFQTLSPVLIWKNGSDREKICVFGLWLATLIISIAFGLASIKYNWSGLPVSFAGLQLSVTVYPPLIFCTFWVLWFGFWWGFIPAYLSTLILGLYAGMPPGWSLLFAFTDPLGLAVLSVAYRAIPISFSLRSANSILIFLLISFVSGIVGSTGAFIWVHNNEVAALELLKIWQGWWLGAFLQNIIFVAPILSLFTPALLGWRDRHEWAGARHSSRHSEILKATGVILGGILLFLYITIKLATLQFEYASNAGNIHSWQQAAQILSASVYAVYWIITIIVIFFAIFGYQMFFFWSASMTQTARDLRSTNATLELLSRIDPLTGLYNRRTWEKMLGLVFNRTRHSGQTSTLILMDVDKFKSINDTHGHTAGDEVLRDMSEILKLEKRSSDVAGRYGGEEFILILADTDREDALKFAERLRRKFEDAQVRHGKRILKYTVSLGLAELDDTVADPRAWLTRADRALYEAKRRAQQFRALL